MPAPDFTPDLSTVTSVLLPDGWHHVEPGTLEVSTDDAVRFLAASGDRFPRRWIVCGADQVKAVAVPATEDD